MAVHEARSATDKALIMSRVDSLATTTAKGLRTLNKRIEYDEQYVLQSFRYMDDRTIHVEDRQRQLESEMRHLKLQQLAVVVVMIIVLLLWLFPHVFTNAMAFCKEVLGLPVTTPLTAPADAPTSAPGFTTPKTENDAVVSPVIMRSMKAILMAVCVARVHDNHMFVLSTSQVATAVRARGV